MSDIKSTWNFTVIGGEVNSWFKNGFHVDSQNDKIQVFYGEQLIDKPFSSVEQAMQWCEGRMFSTDQPTDRKEWTEFKVERNDAL